MPRPPPPGPRSVWGGGSVCSALRSRRLHPRVSGCSFQSGPSSSSQCPVVPLEGRKERGEMPDLWGGRGVCPQLHQPRRRGAELASLTVGAKGTDCAPMAPSSTARQRLQAPGPDPLSPLGTAGLRCWQQQQQEGRPDLLGWGCFPALPDCSPDPPFTLTAPPAVTSLRLCKRPISAVLGPGGGGAADGGLRGAVVKWGGCWSPCQEGPEETLCSWREPVSPRKDPTSRVHERWSRDWLGALGTGVGGQL